MNQIVEGTQPQPSSLQIQPQQQQNSIEIPHSTIKELTASVQALYSAIITTRGSGNGNGNTNTSTILPMHNDVSNLNNNHFGYYPQYHSSAPHSSYLSDYTNNNNNISGTNNHPIRKRQIQQKSNTRDEFWNEDQAGQEYLKYDIDIESSFYKGNISAKNLSTKLYITNIMLAILMTAAVSFAVFEFERSDDHVFSISPTHAWWLVMIIGCACNILIMILMYKASNDTKFVFLAINTFVLGMIVCININMYAAHHGIINGHYHQKDLNPNIEEVLSI